MEQWKKSKHQKYIKKNNSKKETEFKYEIVMLATNKMESLHCTRNSDQKVFSPCWVSRDLMEM